MQWLRKYVENHRGQAMVEFALVVPVLLLLVLGIMEFSLVIHQYMVVSGAAREGARSAALGETDPVVEGVVANAATGLDSNKIIVTVAPTPTRTQGEAVSVTVTYPITTYTPLIGAFFADDSRIKGSAVMRVE
ncbi:hypothetical protein SDC9_14767 [bioreactor metagenome]|uniref:TadE-like domain-containing protein n=1 Tax=bioreactor metagenome TaxID=1076179 RepID=A0A644TQ28_9ZZZZ|nr:pilus assembly protein [Negativicutes bacterium]